MIDLHIHTECSRDGDRSPSFIIDECLKKNITTVAMTDHNSVDAVGQAIELGDDIGVEVIPGIEIDTTYRGSIFHILGYFIDHTSPDFPDLYRSAIQAESDAFPKIVEKLNNLGIAISWEAVLEKAGAGVPTEAMIAGLVVSNPANHENNLIKPFLEGGGRSAMPEFNFYYDFLAPGKPAAVLSDYIRLEDAVKLIEKNGGLPILAHPGSNLAIEDELLPGILSSGIRGLEAFSSYHDEKTNFYFAELAGENDLLITCGSDFHGTFKPAITLGGHGCTLEQDELLRKLKAEL